MDNNTNNYLADFPALNQRVNDERLALIMLRLFSARIR